MPYPSSHSTPEPHRKVSFQFTKKELRIVASWSGYASNSVVVESTPLTSETPIQFLWPRDAEQYATELCKRGHHAPKLVDVIIAGKTFAQIEWGNPRCYEGGHDIAKTIQKCRDAGLDVSVDGMPQMYAAPRQPSQRKRKWDDDAEAAAKTETLSRPLNESVWAVHESPYCKYDADPCHRDRIESIHLSQAAAEQHAKGWWARETYDFENLKLFNAPGEPYIASAIINGGSGVTTISVIKVPIAELGPAQVKKALKLGGVPTNDGGPHMLRRRLQELMAADAASPEGACKKAAAAGDIGKSSLMLAGQMRMKQSRDDFAREGLEGEDKCGILFFAEGLGAGGMVREGMGWLTAAARAHRMSRPALVEVLRAAPGSLGHFEPWLDPTELRELGL